MPRKADLERTGVDRIMSEERSAGENLKLPNLRILIVEDETLISMMIEDMLHEMGHKTAACVHSVNQALQFVEGSSETTDAALLDVNLAGDLVYPVAEALERKDIPFAFITGYGIFGVPPQFSHATVMQKPFSEREVSAAVQNMQRKIVNAQYA